MIIKEHTVVIRKALPLGFPSWVGLQAPVRSMCCAHQNENPRIWSHSILDRNRSIVSFIELLYKSPTRQSSCFVVSMFPTSQNLNHCVEVNATTNAKHISCQRCVLLKKVPLWFSNSHCP